MPDIMEQITALSRELEEMRKGLSATTAELREEIAELRKTMHSPTFGPMIPDVDD